MHRIHHLLILLTVACAQQPESADEIVNTAIEASGTGLLDRAQVQFDFRDKSYIYAREGGLFTYTRIQQDSIGNVIKDVLKNEGLVRYINDTIATISNERRAAYSNSVNSVMYFAFLPRWLNDQAVKKQLIGQVTIKDKSYFKIKVTFEQEGGGKDFEDVFLYWFDVEDYTMDYMAYKYFTDGSGIRFREAIDAQVLEGVMIQDYSNLKPIRNSQVDFLNIEQAYLDGQLKQLSRIELKKVEVIIK